MPYKGLRRREHRRDAAVLYVDLHLAVVRGELYVRGVDRPARREDVVAGLVRGQVLLRVNDETREVTV
jgi:hypothetical protein